MYTSYFKFYSMYTVNSVQCTQAVLNSTACIQCTVYSVPKLFWILQHVYSVQCTVYSVHKLFWTLQHVYSVKCTVYSVHKLFWTLQHVLYTVFIVQYCVHLFKNGTSKKYKNNFFYLFTQVLESLTDTKKNSRFEIIFP